MNILIFGASGATGHELVKQALNQGHSVTAFVRNPSKLKIQHPNLKIVQGDVADKNIVDDAVKGKDTVISALGASSPFKFDQVVVDGVKNILMAMEKNGVNRFIYMSFVGVKASRNHAGFFIRNIATKLLRTEIAGHEAKEMLIQKSNLNWTIVRPAKLTNGKVLGKYKSGDGISSKSFMDSISRGDVADFMLKQLMDNSYVRKAPLIMY